MAIISQAIPNMFNGVSQQPASLRSPAQCELQENFYSDIATGVRKRPPFKHIKRLGDAPADTPAVQFINRDKQEKYLAVFSEGDVKVWDLDGTPKTVNPHTNNLYITSSTPRDDLTFSTVADYTFVLNRKVVVSPSDNVTATNDLPFGAVTFTFLPPGQGYWTYFEVTVNGAQGHCYVNTSSNFGKSDWGDVQSTSLSGALEIVAAQLRAQLPGWNIQVLRGVTVVAYAPTTSTALPTVDARVLAWTGSATSSDYGAYHSQLVGRSTGIGSIVGSKQTFSQLPTSGLAVGDTWRITGDPSNKFSGYWVQWDGSAWVETVQPGLGTTISGETMPHALVREANGTFSFKTLDWKPRRVGDDASNKRPTFIGKTISDVFFHRNRLGMLSGENINLSDSTDPFNFWASTVTAALDTDPINAEAGTSKVTTLRSAVPFNKALLLFSDSTQLQLTGGEVLTQKTAKCDPVTEFEASPNCRPVAMGQSLLFTVPQGSFTAIREYFVDKDTINNDAANVSAHVPAYVPKDVFALSPCTSADTLLALSSDKPSSLFAYKFYWGKEEKVQSAWSEFKIDDGAEIIQVTFVGTRGYAVIKRASGLYLESIDLEAEARDEGLQFEVLLDRRVSLTGTYDEGTNTTTWTLPYPLEGPIHGVLGGTFTGRRGSAVSNPTRPTDTTVAAIGDYSGGVTYWGIPYQARYRFSEQFYRDPKGASVIAGVLKLKKMFVVFADTGHFTVEVTPKARPTQTSVFNGKLLGDASFILGSPTLLDGEFHFPVRADSRDVVIDLVSDSYLPVRFQSAEWVAEFTTKSQRV